MTTYSEEAPTHQADLNTNTSAEYNDGDVITYAIAPTPEQIEFSKIVLKLGPTLNLLLFIAILAFFSAAIILYRAGFDVPVLLKHQIIAVSVIALIQSSIMANTFIIKQTVVNGNFTPALQISSTPDAENPTPRGHLLFLSSLYKGSLFSSIFQAFVFALFMSYSIYQVGSNIDNMTMYCFAGFITLSLLSSLISFTQQKRVVKLLLSTP